MRTGQRDARGYTLARAFSALREDPFEHLTQTAECHDQPGHGECGGWHAICSCGWVAEYATEPAARAAANRHACA